MVMFVVLDVSLGIDLIKFELLEEIEYILINGDVSDPNNDPLIKNVGRNILDVEPGVASYILSLVALARICAENLPHQLSAVVAHKLRNEEITIQNLLV